MSETVVIVTSTLSDPLHRARFLELSAETEVWLKTQPGFLRYELFDGGDRWTDTMLWATPTAAAEGNAAFGATSIAAAFAEIVQPGWTGFVGKRAVTVTGIITR